MWYVAVAIIFFILGAFVGNQITVRALAKLVDSEHLEVRYKDA